MRRSGALGLEALSRGAAHALFVESDRRAAGVLRRNVADLGAARGHGACRRRAAAVLGAPAGPGFDVVVADPPYDLPDPRSRAGSRLRTAHGWLAADAVVVVERGRGGAVPWPAPLDGVRERRYGDTLLLRRRSACLATPDI